MSDPDAPGYWDHADDRDEQFPPRECPGASPVAEDTPALLEFAGRIRGATWRAQLAAAMVACQGAGWTWRQAAAMALRLVLDEDAEPRFMSEAARDPVKRSGHASVPPQAWREARAALDARRDRPAGAA